MLHRCANPHFSLIDGRLPAEGDKFAALVLGSFLLCPILRFKPLAGSWGLAERHKRA